MPNLKLCVLATLLVVGVFSQEEIFYSTPDNVNISDYGANPPPGASTPSGSSFSRSAQADASNDAAAYMRSNSISGQAQWVYPKDGNKMFMYPFGHWAHFSTSFHTDCPQKPANITVYAYPW